MKHLFYLVAILLAGSAKAQRMVLPLNEGWQFTKDNAMDAGAGKTNWQQVNLPHTWNIDDVMDDVPGYYRGVAWYRKKISIDKKLSGKILYLNFEAANQEAVVYINGRKAGGHVGGYTAFILPITGLINIGKENEILVKVDNSYNSAIPPLSADFTFYGGIYRQVSLVATNPLHFSFDEHGSKAVFISTPLVNKEMAQVNISSNVSNNSSTEKKIRLITSLYDANGKKIAFVQSSSMLEAGQTQALKQVLPSIANPKLWSTNDPYLYKVISAAIDEQTGKIVDEVVNPLGFRWFNFDADKGFFLNGVSMKLVGTSRHQDHSSMGNALPKRMAIEDVQLIKQMGGNFLRVAHYPQDQAILDACDSLGILASVEIPIVNEITESAEFSNNCHKMQVEMIRQNYNHASVIIWCYMNEVLLRPHHNNDRHKQKIYYEAVAKLASSLDSITRAEDPYRFTMIACHGDYNRYKEAGLLNIATITGWNLYSGWYGATITELPQFLDMFHNNYPATAMLISEYGADADPRVRSKEPVRFDKSVEYATRFHHYYMTEIQKRPFVSAAMIWNLADFNSETRNESMPHINNKGLLTWDRKPKDPYFYYKAILSSKPFIKILGTQPSESTADSGKLYSSRLLQVASNLEEIEIMVNGKAITRKIVDNGLCELQVPFINGGNIVEVRGEKNSKTISDQAVMQFSLQPYFFGKGIPFHQMNMLLGGNRYFTDQQQQIWIPAKEYCRGSWGFSGGKDFKLHANARLPYGTDKNILGTNDDPIFQAQKMGIDYFRMDLPVGEYELTLYFAELLGGQVKDLPYNLSNTDRIEPNGRRVFDVYVNDKLWLGNFNIAEQYGAGTAVKKTMTLEVKDNKGIEIRFKRIEGEPVLNALQIKKISNQPVQVSGASQ